MKRFLTAATLIAGLGAGTANAAIYTFADFTRTAGDAATTSTHDFQPDEGWTGSPPNAITGEASVYLTYTASWAATTNLGTFSVRYNFHDDGSAGRIAAGTDGSGFALLTGNAGGDPDGAGPATVKPTVVAVDKTTTTSVTFVLKVDQIKALNANSPGGDWWFRDTVTPGAQDGAAFFLYIDPNLAAVEAGQSTPWAAWRSGNYNYSGVSFISDTADVDVNFSNIAIYTGDDTPFAVPEPTSLALLGLGGLLIARRRRD